MPQSVAKSLIFKERVNVWYIAVQGYQDLDSAMDRLQDFQRYVERDGIWGVILDMRRLESFPDPGNWSLFTRSVRLIIPAGLRWACIEGPHPKRQMEMMVEAGREAGARVEVFCQFEDAAAFVGLSRELEDPMGDTLLLD